MDRGILEEKEKHAPKEVWKVVDEKPIENMFRKKNNQEMTRNFG